MADLLRVPQVLHLSEVTNIRSLGCELLRGRSLTVWDVLFRLGPDVQQSLVHPELSSGPYLRSAHLLFRVCATINFHLPPTSQRSHAHTHTHTYKPAVPGCLSSQMPPVRLPLPAPLCPHSVCLGWQQACISQLTFPGLRILGMARTAGCTQRWLSPLSLRAARNFSQ